MSIDAAGGPRIIVALDFSDPAEALALADRLAPDRCRVKIGAELFTAAGPEVIASLRARGFDVFLDLKYHDIPNTVARACRRAAEFGVWMINVHALGGESMMRAARAAVADSANRPLLTAVTVLTSHDMNDLRALGLAESAQALAVRLARLAKAAGLDGVVCAAAEARALRQALGRGFILVAPGIRPADMTADDQRRRAEPREAAACGVDYFVIGRPVTRADDPAAALSAIEAQIASAACGGG